LGFFINLRKQINMLSWIDNFHFNPLPALIHSNNPAIRYFSRRDLLGEEVGPLETLWDLPDARKILRKQQPNGSWSYPGRQGDLRSSEDYDQIETYRNLGFLVEKYGLNRSQDAIRGVARFFFSHQTEEGDIRGIYGNQYSSNYSAAIFELLIKAGYADEVHIERGMQWLISQRQDDGGWASPLRTARVKYRDALVGHEIIQTVRSKPFSHLITGVVLRAFAVHPRYRFCQEAQTAGKLLSSRLFLADKYPDRRTADYWTSFSFPFWFTDLLSALDTLSWLGFASEQPQIGRGLDWFIQEQQIDGTWKLKLLRGGNDKDLPLWISLTICRVMKRFMENRT
jgi:hypothetical protein